MRRPLTQLRSRGPLTQRCGHVQCWLPARSIVKGAIEKRLAVDASGEIIELGAGGCPWKEHLYDLEAELKLEKPIKFCIYEVSAPPGHWAAAILGLHSIPYNRANMDSVALKLDRETEMAVARFF